MDARLAQEHKRWYPLIDTPTQLALVHDEVRFKLVPAGRRSGKTERAKRKIVKEAMRNPGKKYFVAAPTREQVKRIYWEDLKLLSFSSLHRKPPRETELTIYLPNGSEILAIGLDKPERVEGAPWAGAIVDEIADVKGNAWEDHIRPALSTYDPANPDYRPWCWFVGVPDGLNHFYDLVQYGLNANDPDWRVYSWPSSDILPPEEIEAAKRQMGARQFRQEYEASFETAAGRIYEDYGKHNHTDAKIEPHEALLWSHDQNYTPLCSSIAVKRQDGIYILDEIVLTSAVSRQSALEFVERYKDHQNKTVTIYGDPSGRAGEKHGHVSDYVEIETVLRQAGWQFNRKIKSAAPSIKDRQNAVRAKIKSADGNVSLFVNPVRAPWCNKGLATVQLQEGSTFQEDQTNQYQHITTAIGYCVDYEWPIQRKQVVTPQYATLTSFFSP